MIVPYPRCLIWFLGLLSGLAYADPAANPALFSHSNMETVDLAGGGGRVWLGKPVLVTEQIGWKISWPTHKDSLAFVHLTPYLAKFPDGNLFVSYALDPDDLAAPVRVSGYQISKDGGQHWGHRYSVLMTHLAMVYVPSDHDSLLMFSGELVPQNPGDNRNFVAPAYRFEQGGDRMVMMPEGVRLVDWPSPVEVDYQSDISPQPPQDRPIGVYITGNALRVGHRILATAYAQIPHQGRDPLFSASIIASDDGGQVWRYLSTIAGPDQSRAAERGYEGADETSLLRLADGELMAVFRTGDGRNHKLGRAYSHDDGKSWGPPDSLPAWSVFPQLVRTANETIVLSTGRPGLYLWVSKDPKAKTWQKIDLVAFHNRWAPDPSDRIGHFPIDSQLHADREKWETTSYTGMVEVAPNKLLLVYDRDPERAPTGPKDLSRVFVLPIEVGGK
jgi:hypothetical protein